MAGRSETRRLRVNFEATRKSDLLDSQKFCNKPVLYLQRSVVGEKEAVGTLRTATFCLAHGGVVADSSPSLFGQHNHTDKISKIFTTCFDYKKRRWASHSIATFTRAGSVAVSCRLGEHRIGQMIQDEWVKGIYHFQFMCKLPLLAKETPGPSGSGPLISTGSHKVYIRHRSLSLLLDFPSTYHS